MVITGPFSLTRKVRSISAKSRNRLDFIGFLQKWISPSRASAHAELLALDAGNAIHTEEKLQIRKRLGFSRAGCTALASALLLATAITPAISQESYAHSSEPIANITQVYDGKMTPDIVVNTFRNIDRIFPSRKISAGDPIPMEVEEIALDDVTFESAGRSYDYFDALADLQITGLVVLKDGKLVHETYQRGNTADTRWMSMSVAKSITSTLAGAAVKDGYIESLDDLVTDFVPALAGSAYAGASVRDVLMMSSGVKWSENYEDSTSDRRELLRAQIAQEPGGAMKVMAALERAGEPGTINNYSTGETQVLAEVIYHATGKPLADYLSEKIWVPYGMEADAFWWLDSPDGVEIGGSGISATLRDFARFGQFILDDGKAGGVDVLPEGWVAEATNPTTLKNGEVLDYGYMWWPGWTERSKADGAFLAMGIFGQNVYINPKLNLVVATSSALPKSGSPEIMSHLDFFDGIATKFDQ